MTSSTNSQWVQEYSKIGGMIGSLSQKEKAEKGDGSLERIFDWVVRLPEVNQGEHHAEKIDRDNDAKDGEDDHGSSCDGLDIPSMPISQIEGVGGADGSSLTISASSQGTSILMPVFS